MFAINQAPLFFRSCGLALPLPLFSEKESKTFTTRFFLQARRFELAQPRAKQRGAAQPHPLRRPGYGWKNRTKALKGGTLPEPVDWDVPVHREPVELSSRTSCLRTYRDNV